MQISREAAEVAAKVLTLSYKTYSVIFVLIYFFTFSFSFQIIFLGFVLF